MCGIAGIVEREATGTDHFPLLAGMSAQLRHRGPDADGSYAGGGSFLAHRRLSIIDLASGAQPMSTDDGRYTVVFNGEIYNFGELRKTLASGGFRFRTESDTEVLLAAYSRWGSDCLPHLNGMFAFAIWDEHQRKLFAARDRVGKKPFFYHHRDGLFLFASELKSILEFPGFERAIDPCAIDEYLSYGYICAPRTIYEGIRKLEPGHFLTLAEGQLRIQRYWRLEFDPSRDRRSPEACGEELESILSDAVRIRMISDVPLGAFLSGGLDSSAIVGFMSDLSTEPVKTFTIGFEEAEFSELEDARKISAHFRTDHEEFTVRASAADILHEAVWHLDEPFGDSSSIPTWFVSKMAAQRVKVVLSGDGGDEVFGGYTRYLEAIDSEYLASIPASWRKTLFSGIAGMMPMGVPGRNFLHAIGKLEPSAPGYRLGLFPYIKEDLYRPEFRERIRGFNPFRKTDEGIAESRHLDMLSRLQHLDVENYLPNDILVKVDRMSMAHSIELRSPLLDYRLMEFMAGLPPAMKIQNGTTKVLFRRILRKRLPESSFRKPKQGFGIPKANWFRGDLNGLARETILAKDSLCTEFLRPERLERVLLEHDRGRRDYSEWIWCLLVLELWHRRFGGRFC